MKKFDLKGTIDVLRLFEKKNRPTILTAFGVAGIWATAFLSFKAAPKAAEILEKHKKTIDQLDEDDKRAKKDTTIDTTLKMTSVLLPPVLLGIVSSACVICSNTISNKRIMTLSAAYALSEGRLKEITDKIPEILGEDKAQKVREAISKDHLADAPEFDESTSLIAGTGDVLCYDEYTGRYFYSNAEKIGLAIVKLSSDITTDMWIPLNDFYDEINLDRVKMGDDLGWTVEHTDRGKIPVYYTALLTPTHRPCICVQFDVDVREKYRGY